jgi:uncharacterized protein YbjQ (UPF0145 family)
MLVVTTESVPGYRVSAVIGEVIGITARTHNPFNEGIRALTGGLDPKMPQSLVRWRQQAVEEMVEAARKRGANAVIGMRFDNRELSAAWAEICAYGTAVVVVPDREEPADRREPAGAHRADGYGPATGVATVPA